MKIHGKRMEISPLSLTETPINLQLKKKMQWIKSETNKALRFESSRSELQKSVLHPPQRCKFINDISIQNELNF